MRDSSGKSETERIEDMRNKAVIDGLSTVAKKLDELIEANDAFWVPDRSERVLRDIEMGMEFADGYTSTYFDLVLDRVFKVNNDPRLENYVFIKVDGCDYAGYADDPHDAYYRRNAPTHEARERTLWMLQGKDPRKRDVMCGCIADVLVNMFKQKGLTSSMEMIPDCEAGYEVRVEWDAETIDNIVKD